jgi:hypothetical protein
VTTFYNEQHAIIENGKLVLISNGGSRYIIGVQQARRDIRQIEASTRPLADSTAERLAVLKQGVTLWKAR